MSKVDLPNIREPFLAANGQISRAWWIFLQQLMTRIGGSGSAPDLSAIIAALNEIAAQIEGLSLPAADISGEQALQQIQYLAEQVAAISRETDGAALRARLQELEQCAPHAVDLGPLQRHIDEIDSVDAERRSPDLQPILRGLEDIYGLLAEIRIPQFPKLDNWTAPTLLNSWVNFGSGFNDAGFYKDPFGIVHLRGLIKNGTIAAVAFTLPVGYRPVGKEILSGFTNTGPGRFDIDVNGDVIPVSGGNGFFSLDGGTFRAA